MTKTEIIEDFKTWNKNKFGYEKYQIFNKDKEFHIDVFTKTKLRIRRKWACLSIYTLPDKIKLLKEEKR
jgi:hypothetical protein